MVGGLVGRRSSVVVVVVVADVGLGRRGWGAVAGRDGSLSVSTLAPMPKSGSMISSTIERFGNDPG